MKLRSVLFVAATLACLLLLFGEPDNQASAGLFRGRRCSPPTHCFPDEPPCHPPIIKTVKGHIADLVTMKTSEITTPITPGGEAQDDDGKVKMTVRLVEESGWDLESAFPKIQVFQNKTLAANQPVELPIGVAMTRIGSTSEFKVDDLVLSLLLPDMKPAEPNFWTVVWTLSRSQGELFQIHRFPKMGVAHVHSWKIWKKS